MSKTKTRDNETINIRVNTLAKTLQCSIRYLLRRPSLPLFVMFEQPRVKVTRNCGLGHTSSAAHNCLPVLPSPLNVLCVSTAERVDEVSQIRHTKCYSVQRLNSECLTSVFSLTPTSLFHPTFQLFVFWTLTRVLL